MSCGTRRPRRSSLDLEEAHGPELAEEGLLPMGAVSSDGPPVVLWQTLW